jgi:hypothetical protein
MFLLEDFRDLEYQQKRMRIENEDGFLFGVF